MNPLPARHQPALPGNSLLGGERKIGHIGLYLLVFAMAASGAPLPESFAAYPARQAH